MKIPAQLLVRCVNVIHLLPMVEAFMERRKAAGELSFDDQMSLAADIAQNFEDVGTLERGKYKVVLTG